MTDYTWLADVDIAALRALLTSVSAVDGRPSMPDGDGVPGGFHGGEYLLARRHGELVGCVHLTHLAERSVAELVVRPAERRAGIGTELAGRLLARLGIDPAAEAGDRLRVWAHGNQPAAAAIAARFGFRDVRTLLRLRRDLTDDLPAGSLPDGVHLRAFRPGQDEDEFVDVNRRAFAWHPEQGALTADGVRAAEAESWFDAAGFLLAVDEDDRIVGFHWTKVHPDGGDGMPVGEVYVVGVLPDAQGGGLGRGLTMAGLRYLRERRGMTRVMLYTESDNRSALAVYDKLGFTAWDADVQYAH
ncbi:MAG TPA: mycothiol synthase [Pseudonocardiaceae bacterium]|jgi:mycothiol synthase|nr:mycothiol synthase [Pseudonocardiaceae bacterium]